MICSSDGQYDDALGDELMMECAVVAETYGLDPDQMDAILREILEEQLESTV